MSSPVKGSTQSNDVVLILSSQDRIRGMIWFKLSLPIKK